MKRLAAVAAIAACTAAVAVASGAGQTMGALDSSLSVSPNQAGYVVSAPAGSTISYTLATGTWTVPAATCGSGSSGGISAIWVGLGDEGTSTKQEEVGTDTNCSISGKPTYYGWFELVPYLATNVPKNDKLTAGDRITGLVRVLSPTLVEVQLKNLTRHWNFDRHITFDTPDTSTAEWLVEAPASCVRFNCIEANLANFGQFTMQNISAVGNGATGTLADNDWKVNQIQLVPSAVLDPNLDPLTSNPLDNVDSNAAPATTKATSPAGATPGQASQDGSSFATSWVANAKPGI